MDAKSKARIVARELVSGLHELLHQAETPQDRVLLQCWIDHLRALSADQVVQRLPAIRAALEANLHQELSRVSGLNQGLVDDAVRLFSWARKVDTIRDQTNTAYATYKLERYIKLGLGGRMSPSIAHATSVNQNMLVCVREILLRCVFHRNDGFWSWKDICTVFDRIYGHRESWPLTQEELGATLRDVFERNGILAIEWRGNNRIAWFHLTEHGIRLCVEVNAWLVNTPGTFQNQNQRPQDAELALCVPTGDAVPGPERCPTCSRAAELVYIDDEKLLVCRNSISHTMRDDGTPQGRARVLRAALWAQLQEEYRSKIKPGRTPR